MQYYSTNHHIEKVSFSEAVLRSEAHDGGLYMPERLPILPKAFLNNMPWMSLQDIAFVIANTLFGEDISSAAIKKIVDESVNYSMPLYEIEEGIYVMELFHGPTHTVKDFGTRMMTNILNEIYGQHSSMINVLVATTGHSGNAIASALHDAPGINVFVLYPKGLSKNHVDNINNLGDNIHAIEVNGTIDDCVNMISKAFVDPEIADYMSLTSANSLNIGSLLPSSIPYFHAYAQLLNKVERPGDIYVSVPSGNCGNLLSGYIAKKMGLPISRLIAACNDNSGMHDYLRTGHFCKSHNSKKTYAYGMDRTYSVNVPRFMELCDSDINKLRADIMSDTINDSEIARTINDLYERTGYLLDPHSAVAYCALRRQMPKGATGIVMATAHPSLSVETLTAINEGHLKLPFKIKTKNYCSRPEAVIAPTYGALKKLLKYHNDLQQRQPRFA